MQEQNWLNVPEMVGFNVTSQCNLKCSYCFQNNESASSTLSYKEILGVINQLDLLGVREVLVEGGEIFVTPFFEPLLEELKNRSFKTHLISNGTLIDRRIASVVARCNVSIGISIDGPTEESNVFRGRGAFRKAMSGIKALITEGASTYVNCTLTRRNADLIPELVELCNELGVTGMVIQQLHCSGRANAAFYETEFVRFKQLSRIRDLIPQLKARNKSLHFVESEILDLINAPERYRVVCKPELEYLPKRIFRCATGRRFCLIQSNLDVVPCGIMGDFVCGNLSDQPLEEIWKNSERLCYLRELSEMRVDMIPGCDGCKYNPICDGGCRADMYNYCGDWLAPHMFCPYSSAARYTK
jgi:radical SAM protein with 4Fe4S-binding SPASM domain